MYTIPPYPVMTDPNVKVSEGMIPAAHLDRIRQIGDALIAADPLPAKIGFHDDSRVVESKRKATTQWLPLPEQNPGMAWIYDLAGDFIQQANANFWQYDILGFFDNLHYVRYDAPSDHFNWHQDRGDDWRRPQRKLALSIILSDPDEYEGGQFQIFDGREVTVKAQSKGTVIVFPSFIQHRVTPITAGSRRSLIGWACGPRFR